MARKRRPSSLADAVRVADAGLERAVADLTAAGEVGEPRAVAQRIEQVLTDFRDSGLPTFFESDTELGAFYRSNVERILARLLVIANKTLERLDKKLTSLKDEEVSVGMLRDTAESVVRMLAALRQQQPKKPAKDDAKTEEELDAEIAEKERLLAQRRRLPPPTE